MAENRPTISASPRIRSRAAAHALSDRLGGGEPRERGPVVGTVTKPGDRNVIGTHGGSYCALPRARRLVRRAQPDRAAGPHQHAPGGRRSARFRNGSSPAGSSRSIRGATWSAEAFATEIAEGVDIRPSIAVTRARLDLPEIAQALAGGRLAADGDVLHADGRRLGHQDRHRSGLVSAGHRRALRRHRDASCAAPCSSRPAACSPSW